jgi:hypothetical protein
MLWVDLRHKHQTASKKLERDASGKAAGTFSSRSGSLCKMGSAANGCNPLEEKPNINPGVGPNCSCRPFGKEIPVKILYVDVMALLPQDSQRPFSRP